MGVMKIVVRTQFVDFDAVDVRLYTVEGEPIMFPSTKKPHVRKYHLGAVYKSFTQTQQRVNNDSYGTRLKECFPKEAEFEFIFEPMSSEHAYHESLHKQWESHLNDRRTEYGLKCIELVEQLAKAEYDPDEIGYWIQYAENLVKLKK